MAIEYDALQCADLLVPIDAPLANGMVMRCGQDSFSLGEKHGGLDLAPVTTECLQHLPGGDLPDTDRVVLAATEEQRSIVRKDDRPHGVGVSVKGLEDCG